MSISELCTNFISKDGDASKLLHKNVIEFVTAPWGLGLGATQEVPNLYPVQRYILKAFYGLEFDTGINRDIIIKDKFNEIEKYRFNESEYQKFLYEEGRVSALESGREFENLELVVGRRGGKCEKEGTLVNTNRGFIEIQNLGDANGPEYQPLKVIVAQEGNKKSETAYFYNGGERDTIRVSSYYGFENEGTPNHRIKVLFEDGTIQWKFLEDIKENDIICIHRKTDLWAKEYINLEKFKKELKGNKKIELPIVFDENWALLLGVLVGDGTWGLEGGLEVTVGPYPEWLEKVKSIFLKTVGEYKIVEIKNKRAGRIRYFSVDVREFFNCIGYNIDAKSDNKRIPWVVMQSPKSVVAAFIRGLFETDGCVESGRKVTFSTASKKLAQELQLLLLNFGIVSSIKGKLNKKYNKTYYHLQLLGSESIRLFSENIGFISDRKKSLLKVHIDKGYLGNTSSTEAIPYQKEWCKKLLQTVPKNNNSDKPGWRRSLLRVALGNVIKNSKEDMTYHRLKTAVVVAKEVGADHTIIKHFEELIEANYFFDVVTEVTKSRARVYDLNVPDGESFVANGMTNHNTTITSCIISYEAYKLLSYYCPQEYYQIMPEDNIRITCLATSKETASELFGKVTGHLERSEFFRKYRNKPLVPLKGW